MTETMIDNLIGPYNMDDGDAILIGHGFGRYIPRIFSTMHGDVFGLKAEDAAILADPDHKAYWETWHDVCSKCTATDSRGRTWYLHHGGDLWAFAEELPTRLKGY